MWMNRKKGKQITEEQNKDQQTKLQKLLKKGREKKKNPKKKGRLPLIIGAAALAAVFGLWQLKSRSEQAAASGTEGQRIATVTKGTITSELSSSGVISPKDTYSLTSLVEGEVISANFEEGDQVTEGQVLYQIDVSAGRYP